MLGLSSAKLKLSYKLQFKLKWKPGFEAVDDTVQRLGDEFMRVEAIGAKDCIVSYFIIIHY